MTARITTTASLMDVECPRQSGFDVCCDLPAGHVLVQLDLRRTVPRPTVDVPEE